MSYMVTQNKLSPLRLLTSALIAVVVSMGLILVFACLIKWFEWGDGIIAPMNIIIKLLSIAIGVLIASKNTNKGLVCGALVGASYVILSYIIFSLLLGMFCLSLENLWDLIFGIIAGGIVGIISNIIKK